MAGTPRQRGLCADKMTTTIHSKPRCLQILYLAAELKGVRVIARALVRAYSVGKDMDEEK